MLAKKKKSEAGYATRLHLFHVAARSGLEEASGALMACPKESRAAPS